MTSSPPSSGLSPTVPLEFLAEPLATKGRGSAANSRGVTGGVYKTRERIHRGMLIRDY